MPAHVTSPKFSSSLALVGREADSDRHRVVKLPAVEVLRELGDAVHGLGHEHRMAERPRARALWLRHAHGGHELGQTAALQELLEAARAAEHAREAPQMQSRAPLALRVQVVPAQRGHVQAAEHERPPGRGRGRHRAGLDGNRLGLEGFDLLRLGRRRLVVVKLQEGRQADRRLRRRRGRRRRLAALRERGAMHGGGGVLLFLV
mmetsp:Transcript_70796/g.184354  ORF Transcript_70796/g.184354 Transcript_70796/m.184354 type:complete len:204 (+) Transcript_70796:303-914(+)